jgi:cysteine-rich repeat protein
MGRLARLLLVVALWAPAASAAPLCGDGIVTPPEECDDGNLVDGDCCDSSCFFEPEGTVCADAGDPCLERTCDGSGVCDTGDRACRVPAPHGGVLAIQLGRRDHLTWLWQPGTSDADDFADPTTDTDYQFCLLDEGTGRRRVIASAFLPAAEDCLTRPCWKETPTGYAYRNPVAPLQQLILQGGLPGRARITARASGLGLTLPPMPLAPPVLVRLKTSDGACWGANYTLPERNTRHIFVGRGDYVYP